MWDNTLSKINKRITPKKLIQKWVTHPLKIKLINEGVNLVYRFESPNNNAYYAKITHQKLRKESEIQAAIAFQNHLYNHQVPVCKPIESSNHLWVESFQQDSNIFLAHVCQEVPGKAITFQHNSQNLYYQWGKILGHFHQSSKQFQIGNHSYTSWNQS